MCAVRSANILGVVQKHANVQINFPVIVRARVCVCVCSSVRHLVGDLVCEGGAPVHWNGTQEHFPITIIFTLGRCRPTTGQSVLVCVERSSHRLLEFREFREFS